MKHFHIELERDDIAVRTWDVWSDHLRVGSDRHSQVVLPPPFPAVTAECEAAPEPLLVPLGRECLRIVEDTDRRRLAWAASRERMELSRRLGWSEPGSRDDRSRRIVLGLMGVLGIGAMVGMVAIGRQPRQNAPENIAAVIDLVQPPVTKPDDPPKIPVPSSSGAVQDHPATPNPGGPLENRTVPMTERPTEATHVMDGSVIGKIAADEQSLVGEDVDASLENAIDVVLAAGKNGSGLHKGRGGGLAGEGDRMAALAGRGLGGGGKDGWGRGIGNSRQGNLSKGTNGKTVATRARIAPPRPNDVEIGGEAGSRSPESILRVIRDHLGGFRYTYEKFLKENPQVGGRISLKFTIAPTGDIVAIELAGSSTGLAALDEEIKDKARRMRFEPIEKGNVTVTYAFVLDRQ